MRPTKQQIVKAVEEFGMLKYFPADDAARKGVMRLLAQMVGTQEQLAWIVETMVLDVGEWCGPKELRGVFCTKYRPADGRDEDCSATGAAAKYSPEALGARGEADHYQAKQLGAGASVKLLPGMVAGKSDEEIAAEVEAAAQRARDRLRALPRQREKTEKEVNETLRALGAI